MHVPVDRRGDALQGAVPEGLLHCPIHRYVLALVAAHAEQGPMADQEIREAWLHIRDDLAELACEVRDLLADFAVAQGLFWVLVSVQRQGVLLVRANLRANIVHVHVLDHGIVHDKELLLVEGDGVRLCVVPAIIGRPIRWQRPRVHEQEVPVSAPIALLVVSAEHDPRRGGHQPQAWLEEIGVPTIPIVAPRPWDTLVRRVVDAGAPLVLRTRALPVQVIADMHDDIGQPRRGLVHLVLERPIVQGLVRPADALRVEEHTMFGFA
mmetsp:Transcript_72090/g.220693  ORF Transcript_72090/g.220693 Transcript_72090/m.220693 type:complete len:266 (+) Transcript_72090:449-1246(+)